MTSNQDMFHCNNDIPNVVSSSTYSQMGRNCKNIYSTQYEPVQPNTNPLIYCPTSDGSVATPMVDVNGNVYCQILVDSVRAKCRPKVDLYSETPDQTVPVCEGYCRDENSFYVPGKSSFPTESTTTCAAACTNDPRCTGYTYYLDSSGNGKCSLYSTGTDTYHNYQPAVSITNKTPNTFTKFSPKGFACQKEFQKFLQDGTPESYTNLQNCIQGYYGTHNLEETKNTINSLICQYGACATETVDKSSVKNKWLPHGATLFDNVNYYLNNGFGKGTKTLYQAIYGISIAVCIFLGYRYIKFKVKSSSDFSIINALFGNDNTTSTILFRIFASLLFFPVLALMIFSQMNTAIAILVVTVCLSILIMITLNLILTFAGFSNWRKPGGFQFIFMILISIAALVGLIFYFYETIKNKDFGYEKKESESPFVKNDKFENYGYIALIVTFAVGLIAFVMIIKEVFVKGKKIRHRGQKVGVKENTYGMGVIGSALFGILGSINTALLLVAPYLLIVLATFERVFGALITQLSNSNSTVRNIVKNIGSSIHESALSSKAKKNVTGGEFLRIGQEFFGGGPSNGWAPVGTTLLNIVLAMCTNYNYVLTNITAPKAKVAGQNVYRNSIHLPNKNTWSFSAKQTNN